MSDIVQQIHPEYIMDIIIVSSKLNVSGSGSDIFQKDLNIHVYVEVMCRILSSKSSIHVLDGVYHF